MNKEIIKDELFLSVKSKPMTPQDEMVFVDLIDTLNNNLSRCVGMAGNMIGYQKNAIVFVDEKGQLIVMANPVILKKEGEYETEEGCLSLKGKRKCIRYKKIKVEYLDRYFKKRIKTFTDFTAEIILHEMDHLEGILI